MEVIMDTKSRELTAQIGMLETKLDVLETELFYLHEILMRCGFPHGIYTLKATVEDILSKQEETPELFSDDSDNGLAFS
jgi:hypothetical protein